MDEQAAPRLAAVYPVGHRHVPFPRSLAVLGPLRLVDVGEDGVLGDVVQAAFRRPVLLVLAGGGDEAAEARVAVIMAWRSDCIFRIEIVQT